MKKMIMVLFAVMCLAQWIVPGKMVYDSENTIAEGTLYKFKTAPIDPSDPMRGKYITLKFQENFLQFTDSAEWQRGDANIRNLHDRLRRICCARTGLSH